MKTRRYFKTLISVVSLLALLVGTLALPVAAEASVSVSVSSSSVTVEDSLTATITFSGDALGSIDAGVTFDDSVLRFESGSASTGNGGVNASGGRITLSWFPASESVDSVSFTMTFTALTAGSSTIAVANSDIYDWDYQSLGGPTGSASVTVKDEQLSSEARLSGISIPAGTLSPAFSPDVTEYSVTVDYSVTDFPITVVTRDPNATCGVEGSRTMAVGTNKRVLVVTAPDGTEKRYTITITRLEGTGSEDPSGDTSGDTSADPENPNPLQVTVDGKTLLISETIPEEVALPLGFEKTTVLRLDQELEGALDAKRPMTLLYLTDELGENGAFYIYIPAGETLGGGVVSRPEPENSDVLTSEDAPIDSTDSTEASEESSADAPAEAAEEAVSATESTESVESTDESVAEPDESTDESVTEPDEESSADPSEPTPDTSDAPDGDLLAPSDTERFILFSAVQPTPSLFVLMPYESTQPPAEGFVQSTAVINGSLIPVWVELVNTEPTYYVLYAMNAQGKIGFFRYELADGSLQEFLPADTQPDVPDNTPSEESSEPDDQPVSALTRNGELLFRLLIIAGAVIVLLIALVIVLLIRSRRSNAGNIIGD